MVEVSVIGGGLAGSEAAWQLAQRGIRVTLYEMRPEKTTGAHVGGSLAELVCSNSLGSDLPDRASGLLKTELRTLGSLLIHVAGETAVPAGRALAVDRTAFSEKVTQVLEAHPNIRIVRKEVTEIPLGPAIIASGPLTSPALSAQIMALSGADHLYFYDAIAPIVDADTINMAIAYRASRYDTTGEDDGDYINCPMNQGEYEAFVAALVTGERIELKDFERDVESGVRAGMHAFFEGCLPIEIMAKRNPQALAFGPLRPIGLLDPRTGRRPFAVVQLRQDNLRGSLYNIVGFQTNLTFSEQKRILRMIPGLENAEFERYGQMHRNTFIFSPKLLRPTLQFHNRDDLFFAGQITGVEGYAGNIATGLLAGINLARLLNEKALFTLPDITMLGALCTYITHASEADFQPMKANYGIMPILGEGSPRGKRYRARAFAERGTQALRQYLDQVGFQAIAVVQ